MLTLTYKTTANELDSIVLDASLSEQHSGESLVTDHPVETGANIVDHVRAQPRTLRIEGLVVDHPLRGASGQHAVGSFAPGADGAAAVGHLSQTSGLLGAVLVGPLGAAAAELGIGNVEASVDNGSPAGGPSLGVTPGEAAGGAVGRAAQILAQLETLRETGTTIEVQSGLRTYRDMVLQSINVPRDATTAGALRVSLTLREVRFADSQVVPIKVTTLRKAQDKQNGGKQNGSKASDAERRKSLLLQIGDAAVGAFQKAGVN